METAQQSVLHAAQRNIRQDDVLPILDVGPYFEGRPGAAEELALKLRSACEGTGFFFIVNHGISQPVIDSGFHESRRFFGLPEAERLRVAMNESQCGYQPNKVSVHRTTLSEGNTKKSLSEAFKFSFDLPPGAPGAGGARRFLDQNQWPESLPGFTAACQNYLRVFDGVGKKMLCPLALSLDLPGDYFDSSFERSSSVVRMAHYPMMPGEAEGAYGAPPHKDLSFLTFIPPADAPGLDVLLPGGEWLEVPLIQGALLVNTGLTLERWTNSRYSATPHRVRSQGEVERYSNIFFYYPDIDANVVPMPQFSQYNKGEPWEAKTFNDIHVDFCDKNFSYVSDLQKKSA